MASCRPDYQPPLILSLTTEMLGEEENGSTEDFKILATSESGGFSEVGNEVVQCLFNSFSFSFSPQWSFLDK